MLKSDAKNLFGGTYTTLGAALGITRQAAFMMPEVLPQKTIDRLIGVAVRSGMGIPPELLSSTKEKAA